MYLTFNLSLRFKTRENKLAIKKCISISKMKQCFIIALHYNTSYINTNGGSHLSNIRIPLIACQDNTSNFPFVYNSSANVFGCLYLQHSITTNNFCIEENIKSFPTLALFLFSFLVLSERIPWIRARLFWIKCNLKLVM